MGKVLAAIRLMDSTMTDTGGGDEVAPLSLCLLGGFRVEVGGHPVPVASVAQRMLAVMALNGGSAHRSRIVGAIWPEKNEDRALANLRAARWRMPEPLRSNMEKRGSSIALNDRWTVDVDRATAGARQIQEHGSCDGVTRQLFGADLLPDWDAGWLVVVRERHRQLRLHALEGLAEAELAANRPLDAVDTAMAAVAAEPLRESAQLLLLRAHLASGNRATCFRRFDEFRRLLKEEIGVQPSAGMVELVRRAGYSG